MVGKPNTPPLGANRFNYEYLNKRLKSLRREWKASR